MCVRYTHTLCCCWCCCFFLVHFHSPLLIMLIICAILIAALYTKFEFLISGCLFNHIHFVELCIEFSLNAWEFVCVCVYECESLPTATQHALRWMLAMRCVCILRILSHFLCAFLHRTASSSHITLALLFSLSLFRHSNHSQRNECVVYGVLLEAPH